MNKNNEAQNFNDLGDNKHMDHESMQIVKVMDSMINDMKSKITKLKTEKLSLPSLPLVGTKNDTVQSNIELPYKESNIEFEIVDLLQNMDSKNIFLNSDSLVFPEIKQEHMSNENVKQLTMENKKKGLDSDSFIHSQLKGELTMENKKKGLDSDSFIHSQLKQDTNPKTGNENIKPYLSIPSLSTILSIEPVTAENMLSFTKVNLEDNMVNNNIVQNKICDTEKINSKLTNKPNVLDNKQKSAGNDRQTLKNQKIINNVTKSKSSSQSVDKSVISTNSNNKKSVFNQSKTSIQRSYTCANIINNKKPIFNQIKMSTQRSSNIMNNGQKNGKTVSRNNNKTSIINKIVSQKPKSANSNKQLITIPSKQINNTLSKLLNKTPSKQISNVSSKLLNKTPSKQINNVSNKLLNKTPSKQINNGLNKLLNKTSIKLSNKILSQIISSSSKQIHSSYRKPPNQPSSAIAKSSMNQVSRMTAGHSDPFQDFVNIVNKAKLDRKIFTVVGNYFSIRRSLIERGWLEKVRLLVSDTKGDWKQYEHLPNNVLFEYMKDNKMNGEKYRKALIYKLLCRHQVDFYWDYTTNPFTVNSDKVKRTLINRYPPGSNRGYGSKAGLCESLSESHWYCIDGLSHVRYPRTYNLASEFDIKPFIEDFRLTACTSLLKWIVKRADDPVLELISNSGKIPIAVFNFAIIQCQNYLKTKQHKDIDEPLIVPKENDWEVFLDKYYKLIHNVNYFKFTNKITKLQMVEQSKTILKKMEKYWPNMLIDGYMNLWLLKPHNGSQGVGILVCRTLKYILDTIKSVKDRKYVIQKYIERPLLIYDTKFDIRQFFLLVHQPYLQLWMYKECYLRFSSQNFSLSKLHESIHLTNNSIQCRYKNTQDRNAALPVHNMWHCDTFKRYLHDTGHPSAWNKIYKEMKEALVGLIMCCQDKIIARINSFELCGVDFMLAEDFHPYLIEINTRPALYNSTPITAKICPAILEDLVKVTIDHARNPKASTGKFELIYKENNVQRINDDKCSLLSINGVNYFKKYKQGKDINFPEKTKEDLEKNELIKNILKINPDQVKKDVKSTLEQILSIIHIEREKRLADQEKENNTSETFKTMLSEFVSIISTSEAVNLDAKIVKHI